MGKAFQEDRDLGAMLILDGQGEEGSGHLRQEKQQAEPADVRNKSNLSKGLVFGSTER